MTGQERRKAIRINIRYSNGATAVNEPHRSVEVDWKEVHMCRYANHAASSRWACCPISFKRLRKLLR